MLCALALKTADNNPEEQQEVREEQYLKMFAGGDVGKERDGDAKILGQNHNRCQNE